MLTLRFKEHNILEKRIFAFYYFYRFGSRVEKSELIEIKKITHMWVHTNSYNVIKNVIDTSLIDRAAARLMHTGAALVSHKDLHNYIQ